MSKTTEEEFDIETERLMELALEERDNEESNTEENTEDEATENENNEESADVTNDENQEKEDEAGETDETNDDDTSDESNDSDDEDDSSQAEFEPITIKNGDIEIVIDNREDLLAYVNKGVESIGKDTGKLKEETQLVEQGGLSQEELTLLIDAKNGSKEAIAKILELAKVDRFDIEDGMANDYKPEFKPTIETDLD